MKKFCNIFDNLKLRRFDKIPGTKWLLWEGELENNQKIRVSFVEGSLEIGIGEDYESARHNKIEVLDFGEDQGYVTKEEIFEILKWKIL